MKSPPKQEELPELRIDAASHEERHVLTLGGELDLTSAPRLLEAVTAACAAGAKELVVDIRGLDFMDSTGLRAILDGRTRCEEHLCHFRLTPAREDVSDQVRRLLQITGLLDRLPFDHGEDVRR